MYSAELTHRILQELQAKQDQLSWPIFFCLTGYAPTQLKVDILTNYQNYTHFNPDFNRLISNKFNRRNQKSLVLKYYNFPRVWNLISSDNSIKPRLYDINQPPGWIRLACQNYSFEKLYQSQQILRSLYTIPFVKEIYICGSIALEQANQYSDLDLIICTKKFTLLPTALIARFWAKLYLKIIGRDVHSLLAQILNSIGKIIRYQPIIDFTSKINLEYKNNARLRFDIGLAIDIGQDFSKYKLKHTAKTWLEYILFVQLSANQFPIFISDAPIYPISSYRVYSYCQLTNNILKYTLQVISLILYPIFSLQIIWNKLIWNKEISPYVSWDRWDSFTKLGYEQAKLFKLNESKKH